MIIVPILLVVVITTIVCVVRALCLRMSGSVMVGSSVLEDRKQLFHLAAILLYTTMICGSHIIYLTLPFDSPLNQTYVLMRLSLLAVVSSIIAVLLGAKITSILGTHVVGQ